MTGSSPFGSEELRFPAVCHFRIIAEEREGLSLEIEGVFRAEGLEIAVGQGGLSAKGRYQTYTVSVEVTSREQMKSLDRGLRGVPGVRMVL